MGRMGSGILSADVVLGEAENCIQVLMVHVSIFSRPLLFHLATPGYVVTSSSCAKYWFW